MQDLWVAFGGLLLKTKATKTSRHQSRPQFGSRRHQVYQALYVCIAQLAAREREVLI